MASEIPAVKIGPWGADTEGGVGDRFHDIPVAPVSLDKITIYSGDVVDSIAFTYTGSDGKQYQVGPWGGGGGDIRTITLQAPGKYVTGIKGVHGTYYGHKAISQLTIQTNVDNHGEYGNYGRNDKKLGNQQAFHVPVNDGASIVAFFADTGAQYVSAIGVYAKPPAPQ